MAIILTQIKYCYKMSNFCPSSISYLTYCVTTNVVRFDNEVYRDFSQDFQILFPPEQLTMKEKNMKKTFKKTINSC